MGSGGVVDRDTRIRAANQGGRGNTGADVGRVTPGVLVVFLGNN